MRNLLLRLYSVYNAKIVLTFMVFSLVISTSAWAQNNDEQKWWFDVELIVFKRTLLPTNTENFEQEQFDLDTTNANNLLFMETLKQTFQFEALSSALPACNENQTSDEYNGVTFDFEYLPDSTQTLVLDATNVPQTPIENTPARVSNVNDEERLLGDQNSVIGSPTVLNESNQAMMKTLLAPFPVETAVHKDEIKDLIDTFTRSNNAQDDSETVTEPSNTMNDIDKLVNEFSERIKQYEETPSRLRCFYGQAQQPALSASALPTIGPMLFAKTGQFRGINQVISTEDLSMADYAEQVFRQRDIQPLLYTSWRQTVEFGVENAEFYEIRAGNRLKTEKKLDYGTWHNEYQKALISADFSTDDSGFFAELQAALKANNPVDWLTTESTKRNEVESDFVEQTKYELEGQLKVYLDYVNQVPYLHIDTEFNHYRLVLDNTGSSSLDTYPLKQKRRIISKQIHYFDHPAFGLIVRLQRFTPPVVDETQKNENEQ